jgi:hypothetical protein
MGLNLLELAFNNIYHLEQFRISTQLPVSALLNHSGQTAIIEVVLLLLWPGACDFKKVQDVHDNIAERTVGLGFVLVEAVVVLLIEHSLDVNVEKNG